MALRSMALRGTIEAAAFAIDTPLIGEANARERVIGHWTPGARLYALSDRRWLLILAEPCAVRIERSPGVALPAQALADGQVSELRHGRTARHCLSQLAELSPAGWLDCSRFIAIELATLDRALEQAAIEPLPPLPQRPDVRALAKIKLRNRSTERLLGAADRGAQRRVARAQRKGLMARLIMRTPATHVVSARHTRYLAQLEAAFRDRDYESALRDAIGLGDSGSSWLSLRLPRPRSNLSPATRRSAGGRVTPYGATARARLATMYQDAARRLERDGDIDRAAFVYVDLLKAPRDAVALLERHDRLELAAQIAEGHDLDPDLIVRLWWRAGDRRRAVDVARTRGAFAIAVQRLQDVDPAMALDLRRAWVDAERQRGASLAAIEAAWPEPALRATLDHDLSRLAATGPEGIARSLALRLAWQQSSSSDELAALIDNREDAGMRLRQVFASVLVAFPAVDPATDRRVVSDLIRALLRDGAVQKIRALRDRADPLLRADLPDLETAERPSETSQIIAPADAGSAPVHDVAALDAGILVASGDRGLSLLAPDGRVRARWDVSAHALVTADHGGTAVIVSAGESAHELHLLDLTTRRLERIGAIDRPPVVCSFDGAVLVVERDGRLVGIDIAEVPFREIWAELDTSSHIYAVTRSPHTMSALVSVPLQGRANTWSVERWTWELPSRKLRRRQPLDWNPEAAPNRALTADGTIVYAVQDDNEGFEVRLGAAKEGGRFSTADGSEFAAAGVHTLALTPTAEGVNAALRAPDFSTITTALFSGAASLRARVDGDRATIWTDDARVVVIDTRAPDRPQALRITL